MNNKQKRQQHEAKENRKAIRTVFITSAIIAFLFLIGWLGVEHPPEFEMRIERSDKGLARFWTNELNEIIMDELFATNLPYAELNTR